MRKYYARTLDDLRREIAALDHARTLKVRELEARLREADREAEHAATILRTVR